MNTDRGRRAVPLRERDIPSWKEVKKFWKHLKKKYVMKKLNLRDLVYFGLTIWYGRRIGELHKLEVDDVKFDKGIIYFPQEKKRGSGESVMAAPILSPILPYFKDYVIFSRNIGKENLFEMTIRNMRYICYRETNKYFGVRLYPHIFRRVVASELARKNPEMARRILGHDSINTTQRYIKWTVEDIKKELPNDWKS